MNLNYSFLKPLVLLGFLILFPSVLMCQNFGLGATRLDLIGEEDNSTILEIGFTHYGNSVNAASVEVSFSIVNSEDSIFLGKASYQVPDMENYRSERQSFVVSLNGKISNGTNYIIALIDPENKLIESNENDNDFTYSFVYSETDFPKSYDTVYYDQKFYKEDNSVSELIMTKNIGDFDGDGVDDLALLYTDSVEVYTNAFCKKLVFQIDRADNFFNTIQSGLFNNDNYSDIIISVNNNKVAGSDYLYLIHGGKDKASEKGADSIIFFNHHIGFQVVGDVNGDGKDDLGIALKDDVLRSSADLQILYGGSFSSSLTVSSSSRLLLAPRFHKIGDLNGDGIDDFAFTEISSDYVDIHYGSINKESFTPDKTIEGSFNSRLGYNIISGQFSNDKVDDLIIIPANFESSYSALLVRGGSIPEVVDSIKLPSYPFGDFTGPNKLGLSTYAFSITDTDSNGYDEFMISSLKGQGVYESNALQVDGSSFEQDKINAKILKGPFKWLGFLSPNTGITRTLSNAVGDFDGNGSIEVLFHVSRPFLDPINIFIYSLGQGIFNQSLCSKLPLNIIESNMEKEIPKLFPNPASDYVNINNFSNGKWSILDHTGRIILQGDTSTIFIGNLSPGIYIMRQDSHFIRFLKK
ncbi:T9SS type A sorting domain-containing protein [Ekhidna sp.]